MALTAATPVVASSTTSCRAEDLRRPSQRRRVRSGTGLGRSVRAESEPTATGVDIVVGGEVGATAGAAAGPGAGGGADTVVGTAGGDVTGSIAGGVGAARVGGAVAISTRLQIHHRCRARNAGRILQVAPQLGLTQTNRTIRSTPSIASPSGLRSG
jgi:hypothetical protein